MGASPLTTGFMVGCIGALLASGCATTTRPPVPAVKIGAEERVGVAIVGAPPVVTFPTASGQTGIAASQTFGWLGEAAQAGPAAFFFAPFVAASTAKARMECLESQIAGHSDFESKLAAIIQRDFSTAELEGLLRSQFEVRTTTKVDPIHLETRQTFSHDEAIQLARQLGIDLLFELSEPKIIFYIESSQKICRLSPIVTLKVRVTRLRDNGLLAGGDLMGQPSLPVLYKSEPKAVERWLDEPTLLADTIKDAFDYALEGIWLGKLGNTFDLPPKREPQR